MEKNNKEQLKKDKLYSLNKDEERLIKLSQKIKSENSPYSYGVLSGPPDLPPDPE